MQIVYFHFIIVTIDLATKAHQVTTLEVAIVIEDWVASYFIITRYFEIHFNSIID